jgi:SET domain-containing protein
VKVYITALRDLEAGEEIFVGYGKEYWDAIRYNIALDKKREKESAKQQKKKSR